MVNIEYQCAICPSSFNNYTINSFNSQLSGYLLIVNRYKRHNTTIYGMTQINPSILSILNDNTQTLTFDIVYNHSILSSLAGNWKNFYVHSLDINDVTLEMQYRMYRTNLHGLFIAITAFCDNVYMRMYLLNSIPFESSNVKDPVKVERLRHMVCDEHDSNRLADLWSEFEHLSSLTSNIEERFVHSVLDEAESLGLSTFEIKYNPEQSELNHRIEDGFTTLDQFLEYVIRLLHTTLDLKEEVEVYENDFNGEAFKHMEHNIEFGLKHVKTELRKSARRLGADWEELTLRLKEALY